MKTLRRQLGELPRNLPGLILAEPIASLCQRYLSWYYKHLEWKSWHKGSPEWFDHRIDLYRWPDHLNPHWVERGIYSKEMMFPGCRVLDVACGDGFYAHFFYASTGAMIDCVDINERAIVHANRHHSHPNIRYFHLDAVRDDFPDAGYDVICFDGAIDHFTRAEFDIVLTKAKQALGSSGVLTGFQQLGEHEPTNEHPVCFPTEVELAAYLSGYFSQVGTLITDTPGRRNCYIRCSDDQGKLGRFQQQR